MTSLLAAPPACPPRVRSGPDYTSSAGAEAIELAEAYGIHLDPWQQLALTDMLGERPDGTWAAFETGLLVARQNGKGTVLLVRELAGLLLFGEETLVHTSHEHRTCREAHRRLTDVFEAHPDLRRRVRANRTANGNLSIDLYTGQRILFPARTKSSLRGFSGDLIVLDEAQRLPEESVAALLPVLSARPNPQVVYAGTVPGPDDDGYHFETVRDRGRAGDDPGLVWLEWAADLDADLDDRNQWAAANPALGIRLTDEAIDRERRAMGAEQFRRERLSIWPDASNASTVIDLARWAELTDVGSTVEDPIALAIDVSPDREHSSVAVAGRRADGLRHVEVIDFGSGTGWVAERVKDLVARHSPCAVVLDAAGPAGSLVAPLTEAGVDLTTTGYRDMSAACGAFYDAVGQGQLRHLGQDHVEVALRAAKQRPIGDAAWAWGRKTTAADISPLVAITLALWGFDTFASQKPKRSGRVAFA